MSKSNSNIDGMVVVVTGAAQGIGRSYAVALAAAGARVAVCDINDPSETVKAIEAIGGVAYGATADISKFVEVTNFIANVERELGPIGGLVNNAAIFASLEPKPFDEINEDEFRRVLDVNVTGVFLMTKAVSVGMKARGFGRIVNISSSTVLVGSPFLLHYVVSKAAVLTMTKAIAKELGLYNIGVNTIIPGLVSSPNVKSNPAMNDMIEGVTQRRCFKRDQEPEDLTGTLIFFLSAASGFVTGQSLIVDGGVNFQ